MEKVKQEQYKGGKLIQSIQNPKTWLSPIQITKVK